MDRPFHSEAGISDGRAGRSASHYIDWGWRSIRFPFGGDEARAEMDASGGSGVALSPSERATTALATVSPQGAPIRLAPCNAAPERMSSLVRIAVAMACFNRRETTLRCLGRLFSQETEEVSL